MFRVEHHPILDPCFAVQQFVKVLAPFLFFDLDEEAQFSQVYSQNRNLTGCTQVSSPQNASIAACHNKQIKLTSTHALAKRLIVERTKRRLESLLL